MTNLLLNEILPQDIIDTSRDAVLILSQDLTVLAANQAFYANFHIASEQTLGRQLYDLKGGHWNIPGLRLLLEQIVPQDTVVSAHEVDVVFPDLGHRIMMVNVRRVQRASDAANLF